MNKHLIVLYGIGGLSDVGRHAILAALEHEDVISKVTVITEYPELLDETNWECGCEEPHTNPSKDEKYKDKVEVVAIDSWFNSHEELLTQHFKGADAVISCIGHRQPGWKYPELIKKGLVAAAGNKQVIEAMKQNNVKRAVVMSSVGIQEDWPAMEWHWSGKIMGWLFKGPCKKSFKDLNEMEEAYKKNNDKTESDNDGIDYLFIRPVGISEDAIPKGKWKIQQEKYKDSTLGMNMAKFDVARYMVQEALISPTKHKTGVVIGADDDDIETKQ